MMRNNLKSVLALMLAVVMLLGILAGCAKPTPSVPEELTGCTVEVKSVGGKALEGVGVYVYADAARTNMIDFVRTDAKGIATISHAVPAGGVAVLDKVPEGYTAQESYAITAAETKIKLPIQLRQQIGKLGLGDVMFDFSVTDTTGKTHTLSQLLETKKAVVLNLWYVNCNPCKMEFPYLVEAYGKYANDIEVLAINPEGDSESAIADFVTQNGLTFPTARAEEAWKGIGENLAYPTTIIIDRFGTVGLIHTGGIDSAKTFEAAFAYFAADDYVQSTVEHITDIAAPSLDPEPTEPTQATEATQAAMQAPTSPTQVPTQPGTGVGIASDPTKAPTQAPTQKPTQAATQKATQAPTQAPTQKPTQAPTAAPTTPAGPDTNGTLANPDAPVELYGFNDFTIEVGAGEKKLATLGRIITEATLCISDEDAYVIFDGETYIPDSSGNIAFRIEGENANDVHEMYIGNSGKSNKTFSVTFYFDPGTAENPLELKTGTNVIQTVKGDEFGRYYTFAATKAGTLTITVKGVDPDKYTCGITINDKQEIPKVVELEEDSNVLCIELPAGATAEVVFSAINPNKQWNHPEAKITVDVTFG